MQSVVKLVNQQHVVILVGNRRNNVHHTPYPVACHAYRQQFHYPLHLKVKSVRKSLYRLYRLVKTAQSVYYLLFTVTLHQRREIRRGVAVVLVSRQVKAIHILHIPRSRCLLHVAVLIQEQRRTARESLAAFDAEMKLQPLYRRMAISRARSRPGLVGQYRLERQPAHAGLRPGLQHRPCVKIKIMKQISRSVNSPCRNISPIIHPCWHQRVRHAYQHEGSFQY